MDFLSLMPELCNSCLDVTDGMTLEYARLIVQVLTLLAIPVSVSIAYKNLKTAQDRDKANFDFHHDREVQNQCTISLERALNVITRPRNNEHSPRELSDDRLAWLTSSRMVIRYWELKKQIKTELYKTICEEQEEYWRNEFYALIQPNDLKKDFFLAGKRKASANTIDPTSAVTLFDFTKWPRENEDPLDEYDARKKVTEKGFLNGVYGLRAYLSLFTKYDEVINPQELTKKSS